MTKPNVRKRYPNGAEKKDYLPKPRGELTSTLADKTISKVAPESPRPASLLENVKVTSVDFLTAKDIALHELLLSIAHEAETAQREAAEELSDTHIIPVNLVLRYLGSSARRETVAEALDRLAATKISFGGKPYRLYERVPLLTSWHESDEKRDYIAFSFPEPIRDALRSKTRYAYLELMPLSAMSSRYSSRLYRKFALVASSHVWSATGDNLIILSATPSEVAEWVGLDCDTAIMSRLRDRVLKFIPTDFAVLRAFSVSFREIYGPGRGRPVEKIEFRIRLNAPSHHLTHVAIGEKELIKRKIGGTDAPEFRVNSKIWVKAQKTFWNVHKRMHRLYFQAWLIALQEALDEDPVSPGYTQRQYRGHRLLKAISTIGADEAAFQFCAEEVSNPDILEDNPVLLSFNPSEAVEARKERIKASKYARTKGHNSRDLPQVEVAKNVDGVSSDHTKGVTSTIRGFSRPAPVAQSSVVEQISFIEDAGDVAVSDLDAELLGELISSTDERTSKTTVVEAVAEEPVETQQSVDDFGFEVPADDLGLDTTAAEMLADLIDEPAPDASANKLEGIREVIWTADRGMQMEEIEKEIWPVFQTDFDGPYTVNLTVRVWIDGCVNEFDCGVFHVDQAAIDTITARIGRINLDDEFEVEYIR